MDLPKRSDGAPWRNFYGRRFGKALRPGQVQHMDTTLSKVRVPAVSWEENPERRHLDLDALFPMRGDLILEIGFGSGEHLLHLARSMPEARLIGCEPFINGVAVLLPKLAEAGHDNVRVHPGDARDLLDILPDESLSRVYLLYPDPWPKRRHAGRRYVSPENIGQLWPKLKLGGELRLATDIPAYVAHALAVMHHHPWAQWQARSPSDWRHPWEGWFSTRYEQKALREGRRPHYLRFTKTPATCG